MTKIARIIEAAIPQADEQIVDYVVWNRTPYPMGKITARGLYKAASRFYRAGKNGRRLCETCDRLAVDEWNCERCQARGY